MLTKSNTGCGCWMLMLAINVLLGGISVQYAVDHLLPLVTHAAVHAPFWPCALVGLFVAEISIPLAVVTWLLVVCVVIA